MCLDGEIRTKTAIERQLGGNMAAIKLFEQVQKVVWAGLVGIWGAGEDGGGF